MCIEIENNEITLLWNCGVKERKSADKNNIERWTEQECYSNKLNINGKSCIASPSPPPEL